MKSVRKLGLRRFLRLFWGVFKEKYFSRRDSNGRSEGGYLLLSLLLGLAFTIEPIVLICWLGPAQCQLQIFAAAIVFGLIFLAIPISSAISLMRKIDQNFDKFLEEMKR